MTTDLTMSGTQQSEAVSINTTGGSSSKAMGADDESTTMTTNFNYSSYEPVSENSTEDATVATTNLTNASNFVILVIVFSVIILLLAIVIFGVRSSKRRKRKQIMRVKREEDETAIATADPCKESIYLDIMPSATIEADDLQEETETPYVILEFQSSNANEETPVECSRSVDSNAEDLGVQLESQETRL